LSQSTTSSSSSSSSGEKKGAKKDLTPKDIDINSDVEEISAWKNSCGGGVTQGNLICIVAFLNSATGAEINQYKNIFKIARNEAYKLGYATSTQLKFFWVDVMCHGEFSDKVFGLDPSSTPALFAYHPMKSYKSQLIGTFTEKNILSWLEGLRLGRGFSPLPKIFTTEVVDGKWKKIDCEKERNEIEKELKRMDSNEKEDL